MTGRMFMLVAWICVFLTQSVESQTPDCPSPRGGENCEGCLQPDLDLSTGCTTCVEQGPIECTPGQQGCGVGDFTFSALFHSYSNPEEMCGECGANGETVTCLDANGGGGRTSCRLRFLYCLQPYDSPPVNVTFPLPQTPLDLSGSGNTHTFMEDFITQEGGSSTRNPPTVSNWNRSNPFTRELQTWPGQVQFYVVTYHFTSNPAGSEYVYVDRVPIDLQLNLSTNFTERRTYSGIHNISQFDMSFRLSGQCAENYYGPQCAIFCSEVTGVSTCDSDGNLVCVNQEADPQNNCVIPGTGTSDALIGGVVGAVLGVALIVILSLLVLVMFLCTRRAKHREEASYVVDDGQKEVALQEVTQHNDYDNPTYGIGMDDDPTHKTATSPNGKSSAPAAVEQQEYATVEKKHTDEQHKFDNPIYGDELTSNVYAQTSHAHGATSSVPDSQPNEYSTLAGGETASNVPDSQPNEYSTLDVPGPTYEMPVANTGSHAQSQAQPPAQGGLTPQYEQMDVDEPVPETETLPAIYSEVEDGHTYSVLDTK